MTHCRPPRRYLPAALALLSALAVAMPATAQLGGPGNEGTLSADRLIDDRPLGEPPEAAAELEGGTGAARHLNRSQAAAVARRQHGGRVLAVRWTGKDYRVKLLRGGEVRIVHVPDAPPEEQAQ